MEQIEMIEELKAWYPKQREPMRQGTKRKIQESKAYEHRDLTVIGCFCCITQCLHLNPS